MGVSSLEVRVSAKDAEDLAFQVRWNSRSMVFDLDPEKSLPVLFKDFAEDLDAATSLRVPY